MLLKTFCDPLNFSDFLKFVAFVILKELKKQININGYVFAKKNSYF